MAGEGAGGANLSKSSDFWESYASSENFCTFAVGIAKGFEFCRKIFEPGPPPTLYAPV